MSKHKETLRVVVKEPGKIAEVRDVPNTLEALQELVGGFIEPIHLANKVIALVNEDGKHLGLQPNLGIPGDVLMGPVVLVGDGGEEFTDVPRFMQELFS